MSDLGGLGQRVVGAFFWNYGALASGKLVFFVATIVLARTLEPSDFGLVAFTLALLAYVESVTSNGLGETLVYRRDATDARVASTTFWLTIAMSAVFLAAMWVAAPAIASLGPESSMLEWVVRLLSLQLVLSALGNAHGYLLRHSLAFRKIFWPQVAGGLTKGVVAIVLALAGAGVWSLVFGQLGGTLIRSIGLWMASQWRPSFLVAREHVGSLSRVGSAFAAVAVVSEAARNADYLIVGTQLGTAALGFYYIAFRLPELVILSPFQSARQVLFPFYARLEDGATGDRLGSAQLAEGFVRSVRVGSLIAFPLGTAMAVLATPIVATLYGERWQPSEAPFAFIALWAAATSVSGMAGTVLKSLGRARALTVAVVIGAAVNIPAVWFASEAGLVAVAATQFACQVGWLGAMLIVGARAIGIDAKPVFASLGPALLVSLGLAVVVTPVARVVPADLALVSGVVVSLVAYLALLRFLGADLASAVLGAIARRRPASGT